MVVKCGACRETGHTTASYARSFSSRLQFSNKWKGIPLNFPSTYQGLHLQPETPMEQGTTDQSASPDQQASATLSTQASEPALSLSLNHSRPSGSTSGGDNNEAGSARDETQFSSKSTQFSTGRCLYPGPAGCLECSSAG